MTNAINDGGFIKAVAGSAVSSGDPLELTQLMAIWGNDVASGDTGIAHTKGTFSVLAETGVAWTAGDLIYFDGTDTFTKTATSNTYAGVAFEAKASASAVGYVALNVGGIADGS